MVEQVLKKRYQIQKQLGQNGGRQTLLARDLQTQELVAIKLLTFDVDFQWDDLKLFEREAETLQSLSHPAIPRYLDSFKFQTAKTKGFALVQSYIPAKSLAQWVESGRTFHQIEIKQLAKALLEILMYLHTQNPPVIHRDIKPSNILLANRSGNSVGQVYLVDFGSVQTLAATEGSTITVVGTYGYMPPEQFGGRAVTASDLYSLGATLIYLVTGTHPADLPQEDLRIQFEQPQLHLSSAFVDWLKWMTEPDVNSRLHSARQALKYLEQSYPRKKIEAVQSQQNKSKFKLYKDDKQFKLISYDPHYRGKLILCIGAIIVVVLKCNQYIYASVLFVANAFTLGHLMQTPFVNSLIFGLLGLGVLSLFLLLVLVTVKIACSRTTILEIDQQTISLNHQPSSPRKSIVRVGFTRDHDMIISQFRRHIQIRTKTQLYKIPIDTLTISEINWIKSELEKFLKLPILTVNSSVFNKICR